MAIVWNCDICGKATDVNPPFEHIYEEVESTIVTPTKITDFDEEGNCIPKIVNKETKIKKKIPKTSEMKRLNPLTKVMETIKVPAIKDLEPRAYLVRLTVASESIQKDFCKECLATVLPDIKSLWEKLEAIGDK